MLSHPSQSTRWMGHPVSSTVGRQSRWTTRAKSEPLRKGISVLRILTFARRPESHSTWSKPLRHWPGQVRRWISVCLSPCWSGRTIDLRHAQCRSGSFAAGPHLEGDQKMSPVANKPFDTAHYLATEGPGRSMLGHVAKQVYFSQDGPADSVFYLQNGQAKLTVISRRGKEATVTMLAAGDF